MANAGRTTYTEAEINERHRVRFMALIEIYGDKFAIPADVIMKAQEKTRLDWMQFVAERDGKKFEPMSVRSLATKDLALTAAAATHTIDSGLNPASNGSGAENTTGPKPVAVVDNENDREVARFSTVAEAKAWLDGHPNRTKVESNEYIIVGDEADGVNPPPMTCDGCGEVFDAHDLEPFQDDMLCAVCVQAEDDLHEVDVNSPGYKAGQEAGRKAVIIPKDDNVRAAPQVVDVGEGVEFHYGITDKNPVGDLFPTVVYPDDDLIT